MREHFKAEHLVCASLDRKIDPEATYEHLSKQDYAQYIAMYKRDNKDEEPDLIELAAFLNEGGWKNYKKWIALLPLEVPKHAEIQGTDEGTQLIRQEIS